MNSRTISVTIARPLEEVYGFLSIPANFSQWAAGLGDLQEQNHEWFVQTPHGRMRVRFSERNSFGVLDHFVKPENAEEIYVPMRVVANGASSEVVFTLFQQPSMSDADFARDLELVRTDLTSLKKILESTSN
ncbi:MAG TPA: hypothetical protein VFN53_10250 [Acidobacteriaceae bacterium]|nr:hypothetical protein [Acidobacteriaceae bacterium]